jgi:tetratricopeptide (TPR) repeat protein
MTMNSSDVLKPFIAVLALCLFSLNTAKSQDTTNATIDSLIMLLMNEEKDPSSVDVYNALSAEYIMLDHAKSFEYSQLGLELAEEIDYEKGVLESQLALAHLNMAYNLDYETSKNLYESALVHAQTLDDAEGEMKVYRGMSYIYGAMGDYDMAKSYNEKAMDIAKRLDDYTYQSDLNSYMGGLYESAGDTAQAIEYYNEVLAIEKKNDFSNTSSSSQLAVARYYFLTEDYEQALKYYRIALRKFERMNDFRWESYTHAEMAKLSLVEKDLKRAEQHGLKGIEIAESNKLKKELGDNYLVLVDVYTAMDSTSKAKEYQQLYDSLQESLKPIEEDFQELAGSKNEKPQPGNTGKTNGFLQAVIILVPVGLLIFFAGMPRKKK